jgi:hypothetical protein
METEGHIASCATASATRTLRSQSPSARQYVHRTGPGRPSCGPSGPGEEGQGRTLTMHDTRESDNGIVPQKPSNQEQLCLREGVEGRPLTKGNTFPSPAARTQSRGPASRGLGRVRQAAKRDKHLQFTALFHHLVLSLDSVYERLRSDGGHLLIKLITKVRGHTIAQQLLHSPHMIRYPCCHSRSNGFPLLA